MSIRIKDFVYDNRWVTMNDGYVVKFVNQHADIPDKYVGYFSNISDFQVQIHTPEVPQPSVPLKVEAETVKESVVGEKKEIQKKEVKKEFKKVTEK